jgi:peptide/nickel transport system substrate-binding protein
MNYICFNQNPNSLPGQRDPAKIKLLCDQRFRQAVSFAIDRERISKTVFLGLAGPMYGPESPADKTFYNPDVPKYPFSIAKARTLLGQIGLKDSDGDGILELNGQDVKFNILTNVENRQRVAMATIITDDLRKAGLGATFTPISFNKLITLLDGKPGSPYDWESIILGFTGSPEPNDGRNIWTSSGNVHQWRPYQSVPATPWEAEIDELFRKGGQEMDAAKRRALYNRWQVIAAAQLPLIYTVVPDGLIALRNKFGNVKPCSLGGVTWNVEELYDLHATRDKP